MDHKVYSHTRLLANARHLRNLSVCDLATGHPALSRRRHKASKQHCNKVHFGFVFFFPLHLLFFFAFSTDFPDDRRYGGSFRFAARTILHQTDCLFFSFVRVCVRGRACVLLKTFFFSEVERLNVRLAKVDERAGPTTTITTRSRTGQGKSPGQCERNRETAAGRNQYLPRLPPREKKCNGKGKSRKAGAKEERPGKIL